MIIIDIQKVHSWLLSKVLEHGSVSTQNLQNLDEQDQSRAVLFFDYLVSLGALSSRSVKGIIEYHIEDEKKIKSFALPKPSSTSPAFASVKLVYSAPTSLIPEIQKVLSQHPDLQILPLEEAFKDIISNARVVLLIVAPFLEWDGLGFVISELKAAASRDLNIKLLTRGVLLPEKTADYTYLDKVKTLLKLFHIYDANTSSPDGRFEVRDFTTRLSYLSKTSLHYEGIHQKMLVADRSIAYIGSGEIRGASFLTNGECGVILNGSPAAFWADFFEMFWNVAQPVTRVRLEEALGISSPRSSLINGERRL